LVRASPVGLVRGPAEGVLSRPRLLIFSKPLIAGEVKTRLIPALGAEGACALYARLLRHTLAAATALVESEVQLWATDTAHPSLTGLAAEFGIDLYAQQGEDLGARMHHALTRNLREVSRVLLIGGDCPGVTPGLLGEGLERLRTHPVVLGPALDGGYWAIGLDRPRHAVFERIPWGGPEVLQTTRRRLREEGLAWWELPALADLDRPEDMDRYGDRGP